MCSNDSEEILTIVSDTVRRHNFALTPSSQRMFEKLYNWKGHHSSCFENLSNALDVYGVSPERIQGPFNIFMNASFDEHGGIAVNCQLSNKGDFIELRAERDLLRGLTAYSTEGSNKGALKPIDFQIFSDELAALKQPDSRRFMSQPRFVTQLTAPLDVRHLEQGKLRKIRS